jgi:hypothetical protein
LNNQIHLHGHTGGQTLFRRRGRAWMQKIGQRGGLVTSKRYSYEQRRTWGRLGPAAKEERNANAL